MGMVIGYDHGFMTYPMPKPKKNIKVIYIYIYSLSCKLHQVWLYKSYRSFRPKNFEQEN